MGSCLTGALRVAPLVYLASCTSPGPLVPDVAQSAASTGTGVVQPPDIRASTESGRLTGSSLGAVAEAGVPSVEQGLSGILQAIPRLQTVDGAEIEARWLTVKKERNTLTQHRKLGQTSLHHEICPGVVDIRSYEGHGLPPFSWRDRIRKRTWATPALAATLVRALATLRTVYPDATLSIGDIAQVGCGSLNHGTLIRHVVDASGDPAATTLLNRATVLQGVATVIDLGDASDHPLEMGRFPAPDTPVTTVQRILGWSRDGPGGQLLLRVASRRYIPFAPDEVDAAAPGRARTPSLDRAAKVLRAGRLLRRERLPTWDPDRGLVQEWVEHWGSGRHRSQVRTVGARRPRARGLVGRSQVSLTGWQRRKPGSHPGEVTWLRLDEPGTDSAWQALYEAGHISHLSGRDVDLSYVTYGNIAHFARDLASIDPERTWLWLRCLSAAASSLGATLDRVLVDRRVYRLLQSALPRSVQETELWSRRLIIVGGHDAHHHARVADCDAACDARARALLAGLETAPTASLVLDEIVEGERQRQASAARKPVETQDSTPTPSR